MSVLQIPRPRWLSESGPEGEIALSTRCRIARNLTRFPFPWRATELQRRKIRQIVLDAAHRGGGTLARAIDVAPESLAQDTLADLLAWRYASRDWATGGTSRALLVGQDRATSLLVNEEDHIRLQVTLPGLLVESVMETARDEVARLERSLDFALDPEIGFLTTSLVNAGAGIRISVLLHLVGLAASRDLAETLDAAARIGSSVRGVYGEGTPGTGGLFQVSNTCSYGSDAQDIAERVAATARCLIAAERLAREETFGSESGREGLLRAAFDAVKSLFDAEVPADSMLSTVSLLRLAVAEGVMPGSLNETAEWIAVAGTAAAEVRSGGSQSARYETVRKGAALRQQLRSLMEEASAHHASDGES